MYNFGSFDAFIVKPTIMPDFARNLLHYIIRLDIQRLKAQRMNYFDVHVYTCIRIFRSRRLSFAKNMMFYFVCGEYISFILKHRDLPLSFTQFDMLSGPPPPLFLM